MAGKNKTGVESVEKREKGEKAYGRVAETTLAGKRASNQSFPQ